MANKLRLRIDIKIYEKGRLVLRTSTRLKSRARDFVEASIMPERKGRCRVWYNQEKDYWNEFEFYTLKEFKEILAVDTEKNLVETFA